MDFNTIIGSDNYIDIIAPIVGEERHNTLYKRGLWLRRDYGATGDTLFWGLSDLNKKKCEPPLLDDVVAEITRNVDASGTPIGDPSAIILNPKTPLQSADKFIEAEYSSHSIRTLIRYADDYWQWMENSYRKIETGEVSSRLLHFLEQAKVERQSKDDDDDDKEDSTSTLTPFPITPPSLKSIEGLLKMRIFQPLRNTAPCWVGDRFCIQPSSVTDPLLLIFGKSKILNLEDMGILPSSPYWFNVVALDFDYDETAECPQWLAFLDSIFGDDEDSKQTLMEWMGLCLTPITKFQKAMFLVGQKRSGKGTIARTLQKIVGSHNFVTPATADFGLPFGLEPFIAKTLAVVSDARFAKRDLAQVMERVLNITGEDSVTINRKNRSVLTMQLKTKLMFISNEVPDIRDQSGALASRFIFLKLPKSFFGREDLELEGKLSRELPGILRLVVEHLQTLLNRGYFIQPESPPNTKVGKTKPLSFVIAVLRPR